LAAAPPAPAAAALLEDLLEMLVLHTDADCTLDVAPVDVRVMSQPMQARSGLARLGGQKLKLHCSTRQQTDKGRQLLQLGGWHPIGHFCVSWGCPCRQQNLLHAQCANLVAAIEVLTEIRTVVNPKCMYASAPTPAANQTQRAALIEHV
jgi:hypothetical protein